MATPTPPTLQPHSEQTETLSDFPTPEPTTRQWDNSSAPSFNDPFHPARTRGHAAVHHADHRKQSSNVEEASTMLRMEVMAKQVMAKQAKYRHRHECTHRRTHMHKYINR